MPIKNNCDSFNAGLTDVKPDVVIFEHFDSEEIYSSRVREAVPSAVRILDTQDLHSLRLERQALHEGGASLGAVKNIVIPATSSLLSRELAAIHRSDGAFIVSTYEHDLLAHSYGIAPRKLCMVPFLYPSLPTLGEEDLLRLYRKKKHFATIGHFRHKPNEDAFEWLRDGLWSKIREYAPDAELHVYGSYIRREHGEGSDASKGFIVKGPAKDVSVLGKYRVLLAPLRFGAGVKGKISDSWYNYTPVVTTSIGAEGMHYRGDDAAGSNPWGGLVTSPLSEEEGAKGREGMVALEHDLARKSGQLYSDVNVWKQCTADGVRLVNGPFSAGEVGDNVSSFMRHIVSNVSKVRSEDYFQSILWQSSHNAARYMTRYIEAKNKLMKLNAELV